MLGVNTIEFFLDEFPSKQSPKRREIAFVLDHQHGLCEVACKLAIPFVDDWQFAIPV